MFAQTPLIGICEAANRTIGRNEVYANTNTAGNLTAQTELM